MAEDRPEAPRTDAVATAPARSSRPKRQAGALVAVAVADSPASSAAPVAPVTPATAPAPTLAEQRAWAELHKLRVDTERAELEVASLRRHERDAAADARAAHVYTFYASVDADSVQQCIAELGVWSRRDPGAAITVIFNSPGGSVLDGLALFDYLRRLRGLGHHVTTIALGRAASMGAVLLQAGDTRVVGENAFLLVHEVSHHSVGKVSELEDGVEFTRRLQKRLLAILADRSTLTEKEIQRRWARKEWWLDAGEAVELGLADELL